MNSNSYIIIKVGRNNGIDVRLDQDFKGLRWYCFNVNKIILDIGANSGQFSEYMLKSFNDVKVIAFEPNLRFESNFKNLVKSYESRFNYEIKAISEVTGTAQFYFTIDPAQQLSSMLKPNPTGLWDVYSKTFNIKNFKASSISTCNGEFIKDKYGKKIYLAKIDVQGTDISVARNLLSNLDIKFLLIEFQASSLENESVYVGQKNSLVELSKLITDFNLSTIKLFPNSSTSVEYNVLLCKQNTLNEFDLSFVDLLIESTILKRFSEILPIGDVPYLRLVKMLNRILKSFLLKLSFSNSERNSNFQ